MNKKNSEYKAIKTSKGIIKKLAQITYQNPLNFGEVKEDMKMILYFCQMTEKYPSCAHTYKKDMPKTFSKLMKAYHFLSKLLKLEVNSHEMVSSSPCKQKILKVIEFQTREFEVKERYLHL